MKGQSPSHDTMHRVKGSIDVTTGRHKAGLSPESLTRLVEIPEESSSKKYKTVVNLPQEPISDF